MVMEDTIVKISRNYNVSLSSFWYEHTEEISSWEIKLSAILGEHVIEV